MRGRDLVIRQGRERGDPAPCQQHNLRPKSRRSPIEERSPTCHDGSARALHREWRLGDPPSCRAVCMARYRRDRPRRKIWRCPACSARPSSRRRARCSRCPAPNDFALRSVESSRPGHFPGRSGLSPRVVICPARRWRDPVGAISGAARSCANPPCPPVLY